MTDWKIPLASLKGPMPVKTPDGKTLRTLEDAAKYAEKLGKAKIDKDPLWRAAVRELIFAAESEQPLPFTTNAVREAIYGKEPAKRHASHAPARRSSLPRSGGRRRNFSRNE